MDFTVRITASQTGIDGYFASYNVFGFFQDFVTVTFGAIGCDNVTLRYKYHSMWVFSKQKARIYRRPGWNEEVRVHCNIVRASRLICYCQTLVEDTKGNLLMEGMVECCVLDIESFRFVKLSEIPFTMEPRECDTSFDFRETEGTKVLYFTVDPTFCDLSRHLNNAKSLLPLYGSIPLEKVKEMEEKPFEIGVKYTKQALFGTELDLLLSMEDGIDFEYRNKDGETVQTGYIHHI